MPLSPDEQAEQDSKSIQDDRSAIAKELDKVSDDGYGRKPEGEQEPPEQEPNLEEENLPAGEQAQPKESEGEESPPIAEEGTPPAGESQAQETPPTQEELDEYEREIESIQAPQGASTRTTEVLKILKQKNREEHRAKKDLVKQLDELKSREFIDEEKAKEIDELRTFRNTFNATRDVDQKYVPQIQQQERQALGLMMGHGLPQETAKFIADSGGLLRVRDSGARMPAGTTDKDGNIFTGTQAEWYENVLEPIVKESVPKTVQSMINHHLNKAMDALTERNVEITKVRQNPQTYLQAKQQEQADLVKSWAERADKQLQKESDLYGEIAKPKEAPKDATAEQKAEVAAHNARLGEAKENVKRYLSELSTNPTPETVVTVAAARAYRDFAQKRVSELESKLTDTEAKLKASEDRWNKAKSVAQTTRQQATVRPAQERKEFKPYNAEESIKELMSQVPA